MSGNTSPTTACPTTRCTMRSCRASAARRAPARSRSARTFAPGAGGGRTAPGNAACTSSRRRPMPRTGRRPQRSATNTSPPEPPHECPCRSRPLASRTRPPPPRLARGGGDLRPARGRRVAETGERLVVGHLDDSIERGTVRLTHALESRNGHQSVTLLEAVERYGFDCLIGGARRDEEKARAKERLFSHRDNFGQWQPKEQRPELWTLFNTRHRPGEHFRAFPISNWTELDVWLYIARESIPLPGLYYAHRREVTRRKGLLVPVTPVTPPAAGETVETAAVRFRTVGDMTCTCPVESTAGHPVDIVAETLQASVSERGATRIDDRSSDASMERRKKEGYF